MNGDLYKFWMFESIIIPQRRILLWYYAFAVSNLIELYLEKLTVCLVFIC